MPPLAFFLLISGGVLFLRRPAYGLAEVRKCCNLGEALARTLAGVRCLRTNFTFQPFFFTSDGEEQPASDSVKLVFGLPCTDRPQSRVKAVEEDDVRLLPSGVLHMPDLLGKQFFTTDEYCLETFRRDDGTGVVLPLLCLPPPTLWSWLKDHSYPIGCSLSAGFLLLTIITLLNADKLVHIHGRILSSYSAALGVTYLSLAILKFGGESMSAGFCKHLGFVIQYFFVASCLWLNVICFNTWRKTKYEKEQKRILNCDKQRFCIYSVYGWGCPLLVLSASLILKVDPAVPPSIINSGPPPCLYQGAKEILSFFYGQISILVGINIFFFILSIRNLQFSQSRSNLRFYNIAMQLMTLRKKRMCIENMSVVLMMGLSWFLEALSWKYGDQTLLCKFIDGFNSLQGVVLFLLVIRDGHTRSLILRSWRRWMRRFTCVKEPYFAPVYPNQ